MKYSLKNVYRNIIKENLVSDNSVALSQFSSDLKVYFGNFDQKELSLWNEKDGSGGRGEYTVASHFLASDFTNFRRTKTSDFFKKLKNKQLFLEEIAKVKPLSEMSIDEVKTSIESFLETLNINVDEHMSDDSIKNLIDGHTISPNKKFTIELKNENSRASTIGTSIRLINKIAFLELIERNDERFKKYFYDVVGEYDLLKSVTTSGSSSKSVDVFIKNDRIKNDLKNILNLGQKDLSIEVKEVSSITNTISGGSGIRLASGSRLAAMKSDIVFCLTIICIVSDVTPEDVKIFRDISSAGHDNPRSEELVDILVSLKNSQVPAQKIKSLIEIIGYDYDLISKVCFELIHSSNSPVSKKSIAYAALESLNAIFKSLDTRERNEISRNNLDNIILDSIKADYLCILNGNDSSIYKSNPSAIGKQQFLLIHKDEFQKVLGFSSYQMGGTAYTSIKKKDIIDFLQRFFGTKDENLEMSSYFLRGEIIKEVLLNSTKKKLVSEGGLAGHMMHPYEALDMTPRQIINRIKEYGVPQSIIEKVDGQNLFFTVEEDGTLMFARNKEDMTHNDLIEKFTNHPAEVPFVTGGNAIKRGIDQWLSSAGSFGQQEILDIFHPDGEARSFINFEIMHKDHPNQIEYGENYIVFHNIVDFVDGREAVYSSNNSQRLDKLINLMRQGVESGGYILASNRTVDLNSLSNVQIEDYIIRIKEITESLGITEDQFLADGVLNVITEEMKNAGINLSEEAYKLLSDFVLYGEDSRGNKIKSKDFTSLMNSEDVKVLRAAGLTSTNKALSKVLSILSPFKEVFVDLGIDLLKNVKSAYASSDIDQQNIVSMREKLNIAIDDLQEYYLKTPESNWTSTARRLVPYLEKVLEKGVDNIVSTSVEGGVYDYQGDLLKVTGGFAPMNQILGAAYRDKEGIFPTFKEKFMQQESNRRSLKTIFSSIY